MKKFKLGQVVATQGALKEFSREEISGALRRHLNGDCGDLCKVDKSVTTILLPEEH